MAESIWSDGVQLQKSKPNPKPGPDRLPLVGPEPRQKNAPGGTRSFSSSADEFRPAIPRSGWSPPEPVSASPARTDYHALPAWHLKTGTFYFAGKRNFLLCFDTFFGKSRCGVASSTGNSLVPTAARLFGRYRPTGMYRTTWEVGSSPIPMATA